MTLKLIKLREPWNPEHWDAQINAQDWTDIIESIPDDTPENSALRLIALLGSFNAQKIQQALDELIPGTMSRGARLLAMVALGRYAEVYAQRNDYQPDGIQGKELFDALNYHYASGVAAIELGDTPTGMAQMHTALYLANALKMRSKTQQLTLETSRISTRLGNPDPEKILQAMKLQAMPSRRSRFAAMALTEAYMGLGDYETALSVAPVDGGIRDFLSTLLGRAALGTHVDEYGHLTQLLRGAVTDIPFTTFEPEMSYARLIQAHHLGQTSAGAPHALALLNASESRAPDQRALRALMLWGLATDMPSLRIDAKYIWKELEQSTRQMPKLSGIATVLGQFFPRLLALTPWVPDAPADLTERGIMIPLLMGNAILKRGRFHQLPGNSGAKWFGDDLARRRRQKLHPMEVKRMKLALETCHSTDPVSGAWVLRALLLFADTQFGSVRTEWEAKLNIFTQLIQGIDAKEAALKLIAE